VFIPGITAITAAFKSTGHMPFTWKIFGLDVTSNEQAFFAWTWFYVCLGLAVIYYLVGYVSSWRRNSVGAWPRLGDVATPFVAWQLAATLVAAYLWGLCRWRRRIRFCYPTMRRASTCGPLPRSSRSSSARCLRLSIK
jgi:hypothetical protein